MKGRCLIMATLWANQVIEGKKTYAQVPRLLKDKVAAILRETGHGDLIIE